jgi:anti-sigma regulatory factor (Ser/Thr protein kinase)
MRVINWFTISLILIAISALLYSVYELHWIHSNVFFLTVLIVMILEVYPIRLPSGDQYSAGSIGFLFLLLYIGVSHAILAIYMAALAYYLKQFKQGAPPLVRIFVTIGMYISAVLSANALDIYIGIPNEYLKATMIAFVFEVTNFILLEGIETTVFGKRMFNNLKQKILELAIPFLISVIVLSMFISHHGEEELMKIMLYTLFFLLIVILFSKEFMKQLELRKASSNAFIRVLEGRIKSDLTGHGGRVAQICEILLDDFHYPKRKRTDLIQAAIIHDIGKAILPSYIFRKKGELTLSEEKEYKKHPEKAMEIVKTMFPKEAFSNWILHHHERWDGKGFPGGLAGKDIPLGARILAVGNELDHIITRHKDPETIFNLLKEKSGTVLDPGLVEKMELYHIETILSTLDGNSYSSLTCEETVLQPMTETDAYTHLGETLFFTIKNGKISSGHTDGMPRQEILLDLADAALQRNTAVHESCEDGDRYLNLHAMPISAQEIVVFVHNVTPYLNYRKQLEMNIIESYATVINTFSLGKIKLLSSRENLKSQLGKSIEEMDIRNASDVPKSRACINRVLEQYPVSCSNMKVLVAVSEAASNIVKHATGGRLSIYQTSDKLQLLLSDKGSGIPLHELPTAILISGYSSKQSLGRGFNLIGNYSDEVKIYSSSEGTCVLMEYGLNSKKPAAE